MHKILYLKKEKVKPAQGGFNSWLGTVCGSRTDIYQDLIKMAPEIKNIKQILIT